MASGPPVSLTVGNPKRSSRTMVTPASEGCGADSVGHRACHPGSGSHPGSWCHCIKLYDVVSSTHPCPSPGSSRAHCTFVALKAPGSRLLYRMGHQWLTRPQSRESHKCLVKDEGSVSPCLPSLWLKSINSSFFFIVK